MLPSGLSWTTIFFSIAIQETWVVSWLSGALVTTSYRWGYFVFGGVAYLVLAHILLAWGTVQSRAVGSARDYTLLASLLVLIWLAYPISWGLSEGGNRLGVTGENVFYGILDLLSVPVWGFMFLALSRSWDTWSFFAFSQCGREHGRIGNA